MNIRPARPDEVAGMPDLWAAMGLGIRSTDTGGSIDALLASDPGSVLVAEEDGADVGTLIAGWDGWRGNMYRLGVLPEYRRRGIATALVHEGERHLRERGAARVVAAVGEENQRAIEFWEAVGYVIQDVHRLVKDIG